MTPPQQNPQQPPQQIIIQQRGGCFDSFNSCFGGCLGLIAIIFLFGVFFGKSNAPQTVTAGTGESAVVVVKPGPSFAEADSMLDSRNSRNKGYTAAQKDAYWQSVRGTKVKWTGKVMEVRSNGEVSLKCNPRTFGTDTRIKLDGTQNNEMLALAKGQQVTVEGILDTHTVFGYQLTNGRIVG